MSKAHLTNSTEQYGESQILSSQTRELLAQMESLLLAAPSIAALCAQLAEFLLQTGEVDGVCLGTRNECGKLECQFSLGMEVEESFADGTIPIDDPKGFLSCAWRTDTPQFAHDWQPEGDSLSVRPEREVRSNFAWDAACAIPVAGVAGKRDILILVSKHRLCFFREPLQQIVRQLHKLLGFALERLRYMETLERNQQDLALYKTALDASVHGILIAEAVDNLPIRYVNPAFERITGYSSKEVLGNNCCFLQGNDTDQPQMNAVRDALEHGKPCTAELRNFRKNGAMFWNSFSIAPIRDSAGRTTHFIGIHKDITHLKQILNENVHSNALYRALMAAAELVIGTQNERQVLHQLCRLLVESELFAQVWIGKPNADGDLEIQAIHSAVDLERMPRLPNVYTGDEENILAVRAWRHRRLQFTNDRLRDPEYAPIQDFFRAHDLHATAVVPLYRDGEIWALLTMLSRESDIFNAELLELIERIGRLVGHGLDALDLRRILDEERKYQAWLARHDPLTDLLNRRGLIEKLEEGMASARQNDRNMAVALVDLNGFKAMNDRYGHPAGDYLLRTVAGRLKVSLKQTDAVGRLGGDEFVLVLPGLDGEEELAAILSQIQAAVEVPVQLSDGRIATIETSIGVTLFPQDNSSPEHLLRHADRAISALKEAGEEADPRWSIFRAEVDERERLRQKKILASFREGKIRIHYQPIIDLQTGRPVRVEALARLADDDVGLLPPADFLPRFGLAEMMTLTFQVLDRSIQDLHRLDKLGFPLDVGINFEPAMLADPNAMLELRRNIQKSGLDTSRIVLELLERADTLSATEAQEALHKLKTCGAQVALDDVGSAYSSLLRMKELPVDVIKLDRSFSIGLDRHPKELRFLMNLVNLAQALGLGLIAEGIESNACRDALAALGVPQAQGYAIAMPMDIEALEQWLQKHEPIPWRGPTSLLGAAALQLRDVDAAGRIMSQQPSFLKHLIDPALDMEQKLTSGIQSIGPAASKLLSAHRSWKTAMSSLLAQTDGAVDHRAFHEARTEYEENLFSAVLETPSCDS